MDRHQVASLGGIARGIISHQEALRKYYANPNICKFCGKIIEVPENGKVSQIRLKKFCNSSCFAKYNNQKRNNKKYYCQICGTEISSKSKKYCEKCRNTLKRKSSTKLLQITKGEIFKERGYFKARSCICKQARYIFKRENEHPKCIVCGYDKFIEACHIKAVAEFEDTATLEEINNINNLVGLCPNHHKEFDNGLLDIKKYI